MCPEPKRSKCPGCRNSSPTALGVASDRDRGSLVTPRRTGLLTPRWSPLREVVPLLCARLCCGPALATVGSWEPRPESGLKRRSLRKQVPFRPLHWGPWSFFDHDPYRETRHVSVHTHVYTHSHTYTCTHTYKHARTHTSPRLDTLAYTHVHTYKYTHVHPYVHNHVNAHTHSHSAHTEMWVMPRAFKHTWKGRVHSRWQPFPRPQGRPGEGEKLEARKGNAARHISW